MKILFFSRLFYPHIGGVETHVLEVSRKLAEKGHSVTIVTEKFKSQKSKVKIATQNSKFRSIRIFRIPVGKSEFFKKFRVWWWLWQNRNLISEADIIHCHDVFFWYLPFRFLYFKKPVFTTFHGYETKFPPKKSAIFMRKLSERLSRGNICVGDYLKKWYGTWPNDTIYGGVEILPMSNITNKYQSINKKLKILFVGRLEEDTGIKIYLRALQILKNNGVDFEFEACGGGSLRAQVEKYGKVHGFVQNLDFYLVRSDLIFTSSYLSILKAAGFKKPVLAGFDNSLKRDYLKMAPFARWLEITNSPQILVENIIAFRNDPTKYQENINHFYEWAQKQTWEEVTKIYLTLWKKTK